MNKLTKLSIVKKCIQPSIFKSYSKNCILSSQIFLNSKYFVGDYVSNIIHDRGPSKESHGPHIFDPNHRPISVEDIKDIDPATIRLREPMPAEKFLSKSDVLQRVTWILQGMPKAQTHGVIINEDTHLANDLGLDSLDEVEFGLALEDEFAIEIPDEEAETIETVGDAVELIADHPWAADPIGSTGTTPMYKGEDHV